MSRSSKQPLRAFSPHNHHACRNELLHAAEKLCTENHVRLTQRRLQVLTILLGSHQPMGAYEVLQAMNEEEKGITPPIVYRALEFLQEQGLVHRIESLNAFIACDHPGHADQSQFLICSSCHRVAELSATPVASLNQVEELGFEARQAIVEINGLCADCKGLNKV